MIAMTLAIATAPAAAIDPRRGTKVVDHVLIDLRDCELTMGALMARIEEFKHEYPGDEILMDGDAYAIVRRCRE